MTDISTRLLAALDEAEKRAREAFEGATGWGGQPMSGRWYQNTDGHGGGNVEDETGGVVVHDEGMPTVEQAEHIASWDPNTVLRLIARDRALLAEHARVEPGYCQRCTPDEELPEPHRWWMQHPCRTVQLTAEFWLGDSRAR